MSKHQMPAGQYYFGDPCYVIRSSWMDLLEATDFFNDFSNTKWVTRAGSTAYGDGEYHGMEMMANTAFSVDAGVIGIVPLDEMEVQPNDIDTLGTMFTMVKPFTFEAIDGKFFINNQLVLDTGYFEEEEEEYYDDQYDEEEEEEEY